MNEPAQSTEPPSVGEKPRTSLDQECLRCGAMNIPENRICGGCGASLPLVYDSEGKLFNWRDDPRMERFLKMGADRPFLTPVQAGWVVRGSLILLALLFAFYILHRS